MSGGKKIQVIEEPDEPEEPVPLVIDADDLDNNVAFVHEIGEAQGNLSAPIDIDVSSSTRIDLPLLQWHHYEKMPKKMLLTNSGRTCKLQYSAIEVSKIVYRF